MSEKPTVLFVCVHNAGRSHMAAGFMKELSGGQVEVLSAGSEPKDQIKSIAVEAMAEEGIDIADNVAKILTVEAVKESDVVITMGCGDTCPIIPGKRHEDWELPDPAGRSLEDVRPIRDEIESRVEALPAGCAPSAGRCPRTRSRSPRRLSADRRTAPCGHQLAVAPAVGRRGANSELPVSAT